MQVLSTTDVQGGGARPGDRVVLPKASAVHRSGAELRCGFWPEYLLCFMPMPDFHSLQRHAELHLPSLDDRKSEQLEVQDLQGRQYQLRYMYGEGWTAL
jgi:hypothetical protein